MKVHSIRFKFLLIIISAMLAISFFVGGVSIYEVDTYVQQQTENFINVTCEKEKTQVNDIFGDMEKSVYIMSSYILDFFDTVEEIKVRETQNEVISYADKMFAEVASNTVGVVAYYLRLNPEISDSKSGFFYSKATDSDEYLLHEITDLALYDKDDTEHVGWYWQPYEAGKPIWMLPYYNQNNNITMISYVIPLYCEGQFIGVVGMDFDYNLLVEKVHNIKIYQNGFAHLECEGVTVCHSDTSSLSYVSEEYMQVSADLMNGMTLVLSASYDDIKQIRYDIALRIGVTLVVLTVVFCVITILVVEKIVKPLYKLTEASKKLDDGDYNVEAIHSDTYEIQLLSSAFENMSMHLREHEKLQYLLAYWDSMTGLRNTTSYKVWVTDFDKEIKNENTDFGLIVLDLNYLKETNDKYGHDVGNKLIAEAAQLIADIFKRSPVFRIGGDEFLVILQNRDLEDCEQLCEKFDLECAGKYIAVDSQNIPVSIAKGFARYNPDTDMQFVDVFNRADDAMYKQKRMMKMSQKVK